MEKVRERGEMWGCYRELGRQGRKETHIWKVSYISRSPLPLYLGPRTRIRPISIVDKIIIIIIIYPLSLKKKNIKFKSKENS